MATDWRALCKTAGFGVDGDSVLVTFENARTHQVRVSETDDAYEVHAVVARVSAVEHVEDLALRVWRHRR